MPLGALKRRGKFTSHLQFKFLKINFADGVFSNNKEALVGRERTLHLTYTGIQNFLSLLGNGDVYKFIVYCQIPEHT